MHALEGEDLCIQRWEMDACTLLQDIPQTGELYIGDATGRPMGLDGVMTLVYERMLPLFRHTPC